MEAGNATVFSSMWMQLGIVYAQDSRNPILTLYNPMGKDSKCTLLDCLITLCTDAIFVRCVV